MLTLGDHALAQCHQHAIDQFQLALGSFSALARLFVEDVYQLTADGIGQQFSGAALQCPQIGAGSVQPSQQPFGQQQVIQAVAQCHLLGHINQRAADRGSWATRVIKLPASLRFGPCIATVSSPQFPSLLPGFRRV